MRLRCLVGRHHYVTMYRNIRCVGYRSWVYDTYSYCSRCGKEVPLDQKAMAS